MLAFKPVLASFSASVFLYTVCLWLGLYLVLGFIWLGLYLVLGFIWLGYFTLFLEIGL